MSELLDDPIDVALRAHADLGLSPGRRAAYSPSPRRRRGSRRTGGLLATGAAIVGVAGAAAAATGIWDPGLGDDDRGHPTASAAPVPAEQLEHLGVLRRAPDGVDRDAVTRGALRLLDARFEGVRTDAIRAAHDLPGGRRVLVVPVSRSDAGVKDALCLYAVDATGGGIGCFDWEHVRGGEAAVAELPAAAHPRKGDLESLRPGTDGAHLIGLVPDGVASVRDAGGATAEVHDNVFSLATRRLDPRQLTWLDADGREVPRE